MQNVIYILEKTKETTEDYIKVAKKRIKDYLGPKNDVKITYGGKFLVSIPVTGSLNGKNIVTYYINGRLAVC